MDGALPILTFVVCFSFIMILDKRTTQIGMVAFTERKKKDQELQGKQNTEKPLRETCEITRENSYLQILSLLIQHDTFWKRQKALYLVSS